MTETMVPALIADSPPPATGDASCARARPSPLTDLIKEIFLEELADGTDATAICRQLGINRGSFYRWMGKDPAFEIEFKSALRMGLHAQVDDTRTIARDRSLPVEERKLLIDSEWKIISKRAAGTYADKLQVDQNVTARNLNINVPVDPVQASNAYADLMRGRPAG